MRGQKKWNPESFREAHTQHCIWGEGEGRTRGRRRRGSTFLSPYRPWRFRRTKFRLGEWPALTVESKCDRLFDARLPLHPCPPVTDSKGSARLAMRPRDCLQGLGDARLPLHPCPPVTDSKVSARNAKGTEWCCSIGMMGHGAWVVGRGPGRR